MAGRISEKLNEKQVNVCDSALAQQQRWGARGDGTALLSRRGGPELSLQLPHEGEHSLDICNTCASSLTPLQSTEK